MKIRKIRLQKHSILGDLELDFTDSNGQVVDTIIMAGENGVGKSLLLNLIYDFPRLLNSTDEIRNEKITFEIVFSNEEIDLLRKHDRHNVLINVQLKDNIFIFDINYNIKGSDQIKVSTIKSDETELILRGYHFSGKCNNAFNTIFSDVEINFSPRQINSVTSRDIDQEIVGNIKSSSEIASDITQLLIDIKTIDNQEFTDWASSNTEKKIDKSKIDIRTKRFTSAFEYMFPLKRYKGIVTKNGFKEVMFSENGKNMEISKLSSGEKQIVFRGGFLLKDQISRNGSLVLIDEPELSLHPNWQLKILSFLKKLFTLNGVQTSQLIISTHSPFVIHNSDRCSDKVIVLKKNQKGVIVVEDEPKFYSWTPEEKIREAFNLDNVFKTNKTTVFLEGETDEKYFTTVNKLFDINLDLDFKWIGRYANNGAEFTGDTSLNHTRNFILANNNIVPSEVILFYDSDTRKTEEDHDKLKIRKMKINNENNLYKIGVENLLSLPEDFNKDDFYKKVEKVDNYGGTTLSETLLKVKLCKYFCEEISTDIQKQVFKMVKAEIERLSN